MRRPILAALAAFAVPHAALAGDGQWSGGYVGLNAGYGNAAATADFAFLGVPAFSASEQFKGYIYGGQVGFNAQSGPVVLGIEADIQGASQKSSTTRICATAACGLLAVTETSQDQLNWLGTLRARAGVAIDQFLVYGTGGAAIGGFENKQTLTTLLGSVTTTTTTQRAAWVIGAGIEVRLQSQLSVKVEYLYLDTGKFATSYSLAGVGAVTETDRLTDKIVRAGLNYKF